MSKGVTAVTPELLARLISDAKAVRARAYAPYSHYRVGAAIATEGGDVFTGCNIENACFPAGICAERAAVSQMISAGADRPIACVVATGGKAPGSPCGICRQVLVEFARDMPIVLVSEDDTGAEIRRDTSLAALLPDAFVSF